jgi:hypothetical protein
MVSMNIIENVNSASFDHKAYHNSNINNTKLCNTIKCTDNSDSSCKQKKSQQKNIKKMEKKITIQTSINACFFDLNKKFTKNYKIPEKCIERDTLSFILYDEYT